MSLSRVELAVLNNVRWYGAMFDAQGLTSKVDGRAWRSLQTPPPFHSNLVVVSAATTQAEVDAFVSEIRNHRQPAGWSLKDSYDCLDLQPLGFTRLFEAEWIWRDPRPLAVVGGDRRLAWQVVSTDAELLEWEIAWWGDARNETGPAKARQFPLRMLKSPDHVFFAGRLEGRLVGGGIANRSPGVVGLSNLFAPEAFAQDCWNDLVDGIGTRFPGMPIVGYERDADLQRALAAGFRTVGKLCVWRCAG
jgi:hypothetical protein